MVDREVVLLYHICLLGGCLDHNVGVAARDAFAARCARECDRREPQCLRHAEGVEHVFRVARGRDAEQDILGLSKPQDLLCKGEVGCLIVRERRADRELRGQRDRGECALQVLHKVVDGLWIGRVACLVQLLNQILVEVARQEKALHQLADDVLRIRCTAAVAADDQLAARTAARHECLNRGADICAADLERGIARDERVYGGVGRIFHFCCSFVAGVCISFIMDDMNGFFKGKTVINMGKENGICLNL